MVTGHGQRYRLQWRRRWVLEMMVLTMMAGGGCSMTEVVGARDDGLSRVSEGGVSILFWLGWVSLIFV
ncbi:hypothetical protein HanIR_Chr09g0413391 [Helianthus annuus]|nr:hypothetical protein HanIR_Chr09g0413391 [Helianthus annuus]